METNDAVCTLMDILSSREGGGLPRTRPTVNTNVTDVTKTERFESAIQTEENLKGRLYALAIFSVDGTKLLENDDVTTIM